MLEFVVVTHPDHIRDKLKSFNPQTTTWIVSDLKSKQEIQDHCVENFGYYSDESVMRISDFWKMWMRRLSPSTQIVSSEFIKTLVSQFLEEKGQEIGLNRHEAKTLYKYMSDLAPLLLHQRSSEILLDWMTEKDSKPVWEKWISHSQNCLKYIEHHYNCIESAWIVSFLQKLDLEKIIWPKKMIFDLGSQMTSLEMGLFNILAQKNQIEIIVPDPNWKNKFNYILNTYKDYSGYAKSVRTEERTPYVLPKPESFIRFNSEINEIKFVTAKVRSWIESGIKPERILIVSPRIEDYWLTLKHHLAQEGIHSQKDLVSPLISLGVVQRWISVIKAQTKNVSWTNLEMSYASFVDTGKLQQFEKFKAAFFEILEDVDLSRISTVKELFYNKINLDEKLLRDQFLAAMLYSWIAVDSHLDYKKILQGIIKDFIQQTIDVRLRLADWLNLLTTRLAKKEVKIEQATRTGVQVLPINSAQVLGATHRLWIGLDEHGLKGKQSSLIPLADIEELKNTFDLALDYPEESHADFNLRWFSMSQTVEQYFTCSHVSVSGEPLNTSLFFLENNNKPKDIKFNDTIVDIKQQQFLIDNYPELKFKLELENSAQDLKITNFDIKALSPTDLESYGQCSFKFLARKGFNLYDFDTLGLEIEPRQKGTLIHDLFKYIIENKNYLTLKEQDLSSYLEIQRKNKNLFPFLDLFWLPHKEKLIAIGLKFLEAEKSRLQVLNTLTHKTEESIVIYYDLEKFEFTKDIPSEKYFIIRGRLDRLDIDSKTSQALVIDYKSSKTDKVNFSGKWINNFEFQLLIYSIAVEKLFSVNTVGAIYYFYKSLDHNYGYLLDSDNFFMNSTGHTKSTLIDQTAQSTLYSSFHETMKKLFNNIESKRYEIKPSNMKYCTECEWNDVCRQKNQK